MSINEELKNIIFWLEVNKLSLNISKTHYIIFTRQKTVAQNIEIQMKNAAIDRDTIFSGVQIDEKLGWKPHIEYVKKKLSKSIGLLKKARQYLPKECLRSLYFTFVYPYLTYCIHVWGKTFSSYLDPLIKTHKRIVRIITHSPYRAHTQPLFKQIGIPNLKGICDFMIATFMYKFQDNDLVHVFKGMFTINKSIHSYPTRQADD